MKAYRILLILLISLISLGMSALLTTHLHRGMGHANHHSFFRMLALSHDQQLQIRAIRQAPGSVRERQTAILAVLTFEQRNKLAALRAAGRLRVHANRTSTV